MLSIFLCLLAICVSSSEKCLFSPSVHFFKRIYLFIFRKGGREKEREGNIDAERNIDQLPLTHTLLGTEPAAQSRALTRNRTGDLLVCGVTPNQLSHTGQGPLYIF